MSEHHTGPLEVGAPMNYSEHEKTYNGFLTASKYGTMMVCVLMLAMAVGFFTTGGFFGGLLVFVILTAAGFVLLS
ncbi:aa3-type cytochrome c oxidase subunit IV [Agrobacterium sp. rho-8.1]|jgi:NADH:ubiquinone oxidoreductase subunit 2 (subunit N)|nr:aa3-type cytochrome c oxidase subunit IV [Agrobacterium sp. rho-8.1]